MIDPFRVAGGAPVAPSQRATVSICVRCGVVAPVEGTSCAVCKKPLAETRAVAPYSGEDFYWVAIRATFTCRGCDFDAPLDCLDADGAVDCASCGLHQRFEVSQWSGALEHAHAIGDLAGPNDEGRAPHPTIWIGSENPHRSIGRSATFAPWSTNRFSIEAAPGHPVCHRCHVPLAVTSASNGRTSTSCPVCHEQATYELTAEARGVDTGLTAAIAADHRTDQPKAKSQIGAAGAIALNCPSCGAPLRLEGQDRVHTCAFCRTTCLIPPRALTRGNGGPVEPELWWLLFHGPSSARKDLEKPGEGEGAGTAADMLLKLKLKKKGAPSVVSETPPREGIAWDQVGLTVAIGVVALVIGYVVAGPW